MTYYYSLGDDIDTGRQADTSRFTSLSGICFPANEFTSTYSKQLATELNRILTALGRPAVRADGLWDQPAAAALAELVPSAKITSDPAGCYNLPGRIVRIWQATQALADIRSAEAMIAAGAAPGGTAVAWVAPAPTNLAPIRVDNLVSSLDSVNSAAAYAPIQTIPVAPTPALAPVPTPLPVLVMTASGPVPVTPVVVPPGKKFNPLLLLGMAALAVLVLRKS